MGLGRLKSFIRDVRGNAAVVFSLAAAPLLLAAGATHDMLRNNEARTAVQGAAHAAALAGAVSGETDTADLEAIVADYLAANGAETAPTRIRSVTQHRDAAKGTFTVTVEGEVMTSFVFIGGIDKIKLSATAEVIIGGNAREAADAMDSTVSMRGSTAGTTP